MKRLSPQISIPKEKYHEFLADWNRGVLEGSRFGQAFCLRFQHYIDKVNKNIEDLYLTKSRTEAHKLIGILFRIEG